MSARRTEGQAAPVDPGLRRILLAAAQRLERNGLAASGRLPLLRLESDEVRALSRLCSAPAGAPCSPRRLERRSRCPR